MGSSVSLPERYSPPGAITSEMDQRVMHMLEILPNVLLGDLAHIGPLNMDPAYHDIVVAFVKNMLPEFDLLSSAPGLFSVRRKSYDGDINRCCTRSGLTHYWKDAASGDVFSAYAEGRALHTCSPESRGKGDVCDDILFPWCSAPGANIELCRRWLASAFGRRLIPGAPDPPSLQALVYRYAQFCSESAEKPMCEDWLHAMRTQNRDDYDDVIDAVLAQQPQSFKDEHMLCSYPSRRTQEIAARVIEPRECWDSNCVRGNVNFMLSDNYRALANCHVYRCNVSINNLVIDKKSNIRVSCHSPLSLVELNKTRVVEENLRDSLHVDTCLLAVLGILIAWLLIAAL